MGSGLSVQDLVTDGAGNVLANHVYVGANPLMRLDGNGEAVYYLTDAMGSVIGLVDSNGQSVASFDYDGFGNVRGTSGSDAVGEALGGDFRFQGQWLESESGLYYMRARDYDAQTGRFISRDPVDLIDTEPESLNPYQFAYGNPYVYSDPSGEITITSQTVARKVQDILEGIKKNYSRDLSQKAIDKAQGVATDIFSSLLETLVPYDVMGDGGYGTLAGFTLGGDAFEYIAQNVICNVIGGSYGSILDNIWLEAGVDPRGNPRDSGYGCGNTDLDYSPSRNRGNYSRSSLYNHPDFLIKRGDPVETDNKPPAYLIGDFKRSVSAINQYRGSNAGTQWRAILNYAKQRFAGGHQYIPVALYVTLRGEERQGQVKRRQQEAAVRYGVMLQIVSLFD
jgi:RHS repeat-associated protein